MIRGAPDIVSRTIRSRSPSPTNLTPTKKVELVSRKGSTLLPLQNPNLKGEYHGYATYGVRKPDPKNTNTQAVINNTKKPKQHPEIVKEVCDKTDCKSKTCSTHCGPILETKSIGHATKGNPNITHGKVYNINSKTTFDNQSKSQNAVIYDLPHNTTSNQIEMEPHTSN
jgi:hypothetical protein